jgi:mRNA interferase MazF
VVRPRTFIPERGDVVWITLNPQAGRRPAVVLSPAAYNKKVGLALLCPITSRVKGYPFEALIPPGLAVTGAVLSDHVKSLDWKARKATYICELPAPVVSEVLSRLGALLRGGAS